MPNKNQNKNINNFNNFNNINKSNRNTKLHNYNRPNQFSASKSSKSYNLNNDKDENKKVFINLFNDLDLDQDNIIMGQNLNTNKVPKNIIRIINPVIKEILKNKNKPIKKDEFIFLMNKLFNNISSIDKRLLIYTYNNRHTKTHSFISDYYNYNNIKKSAFSNRPGTPNYSIRKHYLNEIINKNYNYDYNYFNSDKIQKMNMLNKNNNVENSRTQKNIDDYLYGTNNHYYYGF